MRKGLALVVLAGACDGGTDPMMTADASVGPDMMVVMPDAEEAIDGEWSDTYHTAAGPVMQPGCTSANTPSALKVDETTAFTVPYSGTCKANGGFRISAPGNLGTYYLRVLGSLYESDRRNGIDLSLDRLGRTNVAAITGVTLGFTMTNLQGWTTGDLVVAFSPNIGYRQALAFTAGAPTASATTLDATANWNGYKVDSAESDTLQVMQLGKHTTGGGLDYVSLDRVFDVPAFTMTNNTQHAISGAFTTPPASSLALNVNVASFNQFSAAVGPSVTGRSISGLAYAAVSSDVIESPALVSFAQSSEGFTTMNFGTVAHGDPYPSAWQRYVKIQVGYSVPYIWNSATGTRIATVERLMTKATAEAGIVDAQLGPPTEVEFDGNDALTAIDISPVPLVTWSAPALGTPTDYEVRVFEVKISGGVNLTFTPVLRLITKERSVRIPSGYLLGQRQYVFSIKARARTGVDVHATPLRAGTVWSSAEVLTALVTTGS